MGLQSTIDNPDPVNRVIPPTTRITTTLKQTHLSQMAKGFVLMGSARNSSVALVGCEDMKRFVVNLLGSPYHAIENSGFRKIFLTRYRLGEDRLQSKVFKRRSLNSASILGLCNWSWIMPAWRRFSLGKCSVNSAEVFPLMMKLK